MSPETRRQALLATARVAMCASLVGCSGKSEPETTVASASPDAAARTEAECLPVVEAAWTEAGERADGKDADVRACCDVVAKAHDGREDMFDWADREHCCSLLEWQGSGTCTPWGPPTPPAMA